MGEFYKKRFKNNCLSCGKDYEIVPSKKNTSKFCSMSCYAKYKIGKETWNKGKRMPEGTGDKIRKSLIGKKRPEMSKKRNELFKKGLLKLWNKGLTKETDERIKRISERMKLPKSKESIIKQSNTMKFLYSSGKLINPMLNKKRMDLSLRNKSIEYQKKCSVGNARKPNKIETIVINIIKNNKLPFNYVGDGKIWFKSNNEELFNPDFLSKNPKHIIELFGDYWHKNTEEKDKRRLETYQKYGYKTLVIWEHEIRHPELILNKIKEFMNNE